MKEVLHSIRTYLLNAVIALDQLLNVLLGGYPDETISSRAYRAEQEGKTLGVIFRPLIDLLLSYDPLHCYESYMSEVHRKQLPSSFLLKNEINE